MTVIAIRGLTMAADSRLSVDDAEFNQVQKIRRLPDGSLIGLMGDNWDSACNMAAALAAGDEPSIRLLRRYPKAWALHLKANGEVWRYAGGRIAAMSKMDGEYFVDGYDTAAVVARAVMEAGHGPIKAVAIACKLCDGCGEPIMVRRIPR